MNKDTRLTLTRLLLSMAEGRLVQFEEIIRCIIKRMRRDLPDTYAHRTQTVKFIYNDIDGCIVGPQRPYDMSDYIASISRTYYWPNNPGVIDAFMARDTRGGIGRIFTVSKGTRVWVKCIEWKAFNALKLSVSFNVNHRDDTCFLHYYAYCHNTLPPKMNNDDHICDWDGWKTANPAFPNCDCEVACVSCRKLGRDDDTGALLGWNHCPFCIDAQKTPRRSATRRRQPARACRKRTKYGK